MHKHIGSYEATQPGPWFKRPWRHATVDVAAWAHLSEDEQDADRLGWFWPLEWRLVAQWANALHRIDGLSLHFPQSTPYSDGYGDGASASLAVLDEAMGDGWDMGEDPADTD